MTRVPVLPQEGGWPLWDTRIRELLAECTALGNIAALVGDNLAALCHYVKDQPKAARALSAAFKQRREELAK